MCSRQLPALIDSPADQPPIELLTTEVAELTGKVHRHVMRDARSIIAELYGQEGLPRFGQTYSDSQGKSQPCLKLPERELLVLLTGYGRAPGDLAIRPPAQ